MSQSAQATAELQGLPGYIIPGTWQAPTTSRNPIVVDRQIRGSLQFVTGNTGDRMTDIIGSRLQYGMIVYMETGYNNTLYNRPSNSYYTYQKQATDPVRSITTGQLSNSEANWSLFGRERNYAIFIKYSDQDVLNNTVFNSYTGTVTGPGVNMSLNSDTGSGPVVSLTGIVDHLFTVNVAGTYLIKMHNTFSPGRSDYAFRRWFEFRKHGTTINLLTSENNSRYFYVMTNLPGVWSRTDYAKLKLEKDASYFFLLPGNGSDDRWWHYTGSSVEFHLTD